MRIDELLRLCPQLFHMAENGSWPNIMKYGLLSTSALLDLYHKQGTEREVIECQWRSQKRPIHCNGLVDAVIRDQIPMPPEKLATCLIGGLTASDWYKIINRKIFFWTTLRSLQMFLSANEYKNKPQEVITVSTDIVIERHASRVTLSSINSGSTYFVPSKRSDPWKRGPQTFKQISDYTARWVTEFVVEEGLTDITEMTVSVDRWIAHRKNYEEPQFQKLAHIWP